LRDESFSSHPLMNEEQFRSGLQKYLTQIRQEVLALESKQHSSASSKPIPITTDKVGQEI